MAIRGTGILICGMHRSGTSALGGAFHACGAVLRENMPADHRNPKGFFEKIEVVDLHEEFFKHFGLDGLSIKPLPPGWETSSAAERARTQIAELVESDFGHEALWAVKDPRICRLVPLWLSALPAADLRAVLALRDPLEVAGSFSFVTGHSTSRGLYLWLRFVLEAERNTRGIKRTAVRYHDLLGSPLSVMARVESELELRWPNSPEAIAENLKSWVDANLNRNASARHFTLKRELDALTSLCLEVYDLFHPDSFQRNRDRLDAVWDQLPALDTFGGKASLFFQNGPLLGALSVTTGYRPNVWQKMGAVDPGWRKRATADLDGNGIPELLFQNDTSLAILSVTPDFLPNTWKPIGAIGAGWQLRGAVSITGNGNLDLVFQNGKLLGYLELNSTGNPVSWNGLGQVDSGWGLRAVADLSGSGRPDLIFQNGTSLGALTLGASGASTSWTGIGAVDAGWTLCDALDVTGSGQPDLIFQKGTSLGALKISNLLQPVAWHEIGAMTPGWTLSYE